MPKDINNLKTKARYEIKLVIKKTTVFSSQNLRDASENIRLCSNSESPARVTTVWTECEGFFSIFLPVLRTCMRVSRPLPPQLLLFCPRSAPPPVP